MRLDNYARASLVVSSDRSVQVFDWMLKDLGTFRSEDVTYCLSDDSCHRQRLTLQLPEVGTVSVLADNDAGAVEILRQGNVAEIDRPRRGSHLLVVVSAVIALSFGSVVAIETARAVRYWAVSRDFLWPCVAYLGFLLSAIVLRIKTGIKAGPLLRRIIFLK